MRTALIFGIIGAMMIAVVGYGFAQDPKPDYKQINTKLRDQLRKERQELRYLRKLAAPILNPSPDGNRTLASAYFGDEYECAAKIIEGETAGTWDHTIWNYEGSGAYGLGQARPRSKMLPYGYADLNAYDNPMPQLIWMRAYADERFGGICNASAQWSYARSW